MAKLNHLQFDIPLLFAEDTVAWFRANEHVTTCYSAVNMKSPICNPNPSMTTVYVDGTFTKCDIDEIMWGKGIAVATTEVFDGEDTNT